MSAPGGTPRRGPFVARNRASGNPDRLPARRRENNMSRSARGKCHDSCLRTTRFRFPDNLTSCMFVNKIEAASKYLNYNNLHCRAMIRKPWTDVAQICLNGHLVNTATISHPELNSAFCEKCGKKTITCCTECGQKIPGYIHGQYGPYSGYAVPSHCGRCGEPHPWIKSQKTSVNKSKLLENLPRLLGAVASYLNFFRVL